MSFFVDFFLPEICFFCRLEGSVICYECYKKYIYYKLAKKCHVCKKRVYSGKVHSECKNLTWLDGVFTFTKYSKNLSRILKISKYSGVKNTYIYLARAFSHTLTKEYVFDTNSILVPIPMFESKQKERGFNQTELIAKEIGKNSGISVHSILVKVKNTKSQAKTKFLERNINLKNSFDISYKDMLNNIDKNQSVYLVDDVLTTGATLNEAGKILKKSGFEKVYGLVLGMK